MGDREPQGVGEGGTRNVAALCHLLREFTSKSFSLLARGFFFSY
jgi:hypothetical protein